MDWPSDRISKGGIFHTPKVNYSKETHDMIKLLMQESNLTMLQRNKINYHLRNGDFLPNPKMQSRAIPSNQNDQRIAEAIINKSRVARKRTLETIEQSGVFNREKFVPKIDYHVSEAKQRLQEKMSGCKIYPELERVQLKNKDKHRIKKSSDEPDDRIAERKTAFYIHFFTQNIMKLCFNFSPF